MEHTLTADGLIQSIIRIVAEASMELPPLVHASDAEFLRKQTCKAISLFWEQYLSELSPEAKAAWKSASYENEIGSIAEWVLANADLGSNPSIDDRVGRALDFAEKEMKRGIQSDYRLFAAAYPA